MNTQGPSLTALGLMILSTTVVSANPPTDVPSRHWAAPAVRSILDKKIMIGESDGKFQGSKPVTRYELAVTLDRFIRYMETGRKPLHVSPSPAKSSISAIGAPKFKAAYDCLITGGFVPLDSPLFQGKGNEPVTAQQFSDAVGRVIIRLSDRSLPPNKE